MRLTAIKMAGFKSFVDPTTLIVPTNLTGVVGPNGCGKSNIIDAIRWVMGEGSAKLLRGESMADVIFSGSSSRKPVGTATVELFFDNSDGRVGGEYAGYAEISVKRQVSRDGISIYSLNNTRCRRKDITDLFLGTGLGARSYSIIEQGMISQIVDARPEEIRGHLEEAAGISLYKERRRETENRIRHTRDNLDRLNDLREEVGRNLNKLKRQARAAERYKKFKEQARELESRLLALRWRVLKQDEGSRNTGLQQEVTRMESLVAGQRASEANLEKIREEQATAAEHFSTVQGELYEVGGEIARLEQTISHEREMQSRQRQEHEETSENLKDLEQHIVLDRAQVEQSSVELAHLEPELEKAIGAEAAADKANQEAEAAVAKWQARFDAHMTEAGAKTQQAEIDKTTIDHLEQRITSASRRIKELASEQSDTDAGALKSQLGNLEKSRGVADKTLRKAEKNLADGLAGLEQYREQLESAREEQSGLLGQQHALNGRLGALRALEESANRADGGTLEWINNQGLKAANSLSRVIKVDPEWTVAAELTLSQWLEALVDKKPGDHVDAFSQLESGRLSLISADSGKVTPRPGSLAAKVDAPDVIREYLNSIDCAASLSEAKKKLDSLAPGESVVTAAGEWLGTGWARVAHGEPQEAGVLARERQCEEISQQLQDVTALLKKANQQFEQHGKAVAASEARRLESQAAMNAATTEYAQAHASLNQYRDHGEDLERRNLLAGEQHKTLQEQLKTDQEQLKALRKSLTSQVDNMAGLQEERNLLESERKTVLNTRDKTRAALGSLRERRHELALRAESRRAGLESLRQALGRMDSQLGQLQQRFVQLSEFLARAEEPEKVHRRAMEKLLESRVEVEKRLAASREAVQNLENRYREQDGKRLKLVQDADAAREVLERRRLSLQEVQLRAQTLSERLAEMDLDIESLAAELSDEDDPDEWQQKLEVLEQRIQRLEPVNLAAIQEFEEGQERKQYLDTQNDDLMEALTTLEGAIEKIDRKTRTQFKDTYERVNKGVEELFPHLFGGGHAFLELTGDDLLTTGVSIMARPPGKRVSSIHLLSGGEKALTAVAFVFAIFQLNPAPFCLLDEVDAPLDDANVARFSSMVKDMSEDVQFIFVTHNKITMEMSHQLCGVTMREPGVSRLVSVDLKEAAQMAAS